MNKISLKEVVNYTTQKISSTELNIDTYISTDNILQNKQGITSSLQLPVISGNIPKYDAGNILVSNIRPYLKKIYYAKKSGGVSNDVLTFQVKETFDSKFVYYSLFQDSFFEHMMSGSKGTKMPRGDKRQILDYKISKFDLLTQQKIASVLSALDDKIELNNRINAELEAMAKTLYDYWFVQFDFPIVTSSGVEKPYKTSGGKMVYNETLKREIPEGWEVKKLKEIVKKISNSINPNDFQDLKYLPIDKLPKKSFSYSDFEDRENANSSLIKFDKDDILLGAMRVYFHRVCLAYEDGISRNTIFVLRPKHKFLRLFSLFLINKEETIQFANDNSTGSSIPYAKWENGLADYQFCLPSENLIVKFEKQISPIMDKIINNSKQNQELSALRDWLLPMLMNGQVKVGMLD